MSKSDIKLERNRYQFDRLFPELRKLPDEVRDHLALTSNKIRHWLMPQWWLRTCYPVVLIPMWLVVNPHIPPDTKLEEWARSFITIMLISLIIISVRPATRYCKRTVVQNELFRLKIRIPACLICHYDLRGTPDESTACPECGAAIAAVVGGASYGESVPQPPALPGGSGGAPGVDEQQTPGGAGG